MTAHGQGEWTDDPELGYTRRELAGDAMLVSILQDKFPEPGKLAVLTRDDLDKVVRLAREGGATSIGIGFIDFEWAGKP